MAHTRGRRLPPNLPRLPACYLAHRKVESRRGAMVRLPSLAAGPGRRLRRTPMPTMPAIVLVVDDDPDVLNMLAVTLLSANYTVLRACDGAEALAIVERE